MFLVDETQQATIVDISLLVRWAFMVLRLLKVHTIGNIANIQDKQYHMQHEQVTNRFFFRSGATR